MEFNKKELTVIYSMLQVCSTTLDKKKKHKSKNDILVQTELENISNKIKKYLEEKEN